MLEGGRCQTRRRSRRIRDGNLDAWRRLRVCRRRTKGDEHGGLQLTIHDIGSGTTAAHAPERRCFRHLSDSAAHGFRSRMTVREFRKVQPCNCPMRPASSGKTHRARSRKEAYAALAESEGSKHGSAEGLEDPDPADQGFDGENDVPVDARGERERPPRLTIIATTTCEGDLCHPGFARRGIESL
jgi:hypothetical protein